MKYPDELVISIEVHQSHFEIHDYQRKHVSKLQAGAGGQQSGNLLGTSRVSSKEKVPYILMLRKK